jgi:glycine/D-amino acid oxidase-like deaminating enzyme
MLTETQVAVIGAGVIGCSIAYYLARRGMSVTVIDADGIGTGTSSATLGLVWVLGAIYSPHGGEINPIKLVWNLARNAKNWEQSSLCIHL